MSSDAKRAERTAVAAEARSGGASSSGADAGEVPSSRLGFDPNSPALAKLPTPSLLLDLDALERNLSRMDRFLAQRQTWARPHTKTHKSPQIAALQLEQERSVGICCARVSEAEAMVRSGVDRVLLTSPITTTEKIERFVELLCTNGDGASPDVLTVVDGALGVRRLAEELGRRGERCGVVVDLDPGFHRTGVQMGAPAVELTREILSHSELDLRGLQMYAGNLMHLEDAEERRTRSRDLWREASRTAESLRTLGVACPVLTGGGTGTFDIDSELGIASDLQVGSYVFMDAQYRVIDSPASRGLTAPFDYFEPSLFVLASTVSQSVPHLITVDAGFKALSCDHVPEVAQYPGMQYHFAGDEHGIVELRQHTSDVELGERLALLVSHCDPTVNLHQHYVVLRGGEVADRWQIAARGIA